MKDNCRGIGIFYKSKALLKTSSLLALFLFGITLFQMPPARAITIEEQAGKREKVEKNQYNDEFSKKAPERREPTSLPPEKDPRLACLLSLMVPGAGHIYLRQDMKGIGFCLMAGAAYATSGYYLYSAFTKASGTDKKGKLIIAGLLFMVGAIVHVIGIVEAYNDAVTFNEKRFYYGENKSQSPYIARLVKQRK